MDWPRPLTNVRSRLGEKFTSSRISLHTAYWTRRSHARTSSRYPGARWKIWSSGFNELPPPREKPGEARRLTQAPSFSSWRCSPSARYVELLLFSFFFSRRSSHISSWLVLISSIPGRYKSLTNKSAKSTLKKKNLKELLSFLVSHNPSLESYESLF